ncbi:MAG: hypothetical protein B9S32_00220 [Verrucomicrobia bacterium Tous-C9LFEB]|nr:MAG: hypothetical protein B9S32_00220 [Verrucomicrobia bacterium Tous-C9LFEB]
MSFDNLTPRAKVVQPIRSEAKLEIRFNQVLVERCASDAPYRYVFEAVRSKLAEVKLTEVSRNFEKGEIVTTFRWMGFVPVTLRMAFYSAGLSTIMDADAEAGRGWFHRARDRKARQLVERLTATVFAGTTLAAAVAVYPEETRAPEHTVGS